MADYRVNVFKGIRPGISSKKLPQGEAQTAENAKLGSGDLEAWYEKDAGTALSSTYYNRTIYKYPNGGSAIWFEWDDYVDVARGPLKDDSLDRVYYTGVTAGEGRPRMTYTTIADGGGGGPYPEDFRYLGVPAPVNPCSASVPPLPEDKLRAERIITALECDAFVVDEVRFTVYPGTGTDNQTWRPNSGLEGTIAFELEVGTSFRVSEVIDANTVELERADARGVFARTKYSDKSGANSWKPMDEQGSTKEADFLGWRIPEARATITGHRLRIGDVITITTTSASGVIEYFPATTEDFYEQSWDTERAVEEGGTTHYEVRDARISASATEGDTVFDLGDFTIGYNVDRAASDVSEVEDRTYIYTYVTGLGEEGPPSDPSNFVYAIDGDLATLSGFAYPPQTGYDITKSRVYRSNTTSQGTEYQFVREFTYNVTDQVTYDSLKDEDLGEVIETTTWFRPPAGMQGITDLPNGMMAGFKGKNLYLCEPYRPHAWPPEYDQAVTYDIVGIAAFGNALAIMTTGWPYIMTGSHPRNVNLRPIKIHQACVSKQSIATDGDRVYYASPDGLIEIGVNGLRNVTGSHMGKDEWQEYLPGTMVGGIYDGAYFGFWDGPDNVTQPPITVALGGTVTSSAEPSNIRAGGLTITLTVTSDTWVASGATFNAQRQNIIDGLVAYPQFANDLDWDLVLSTLDVTDVVRTSDTVVTITLPAVATYSIEALQTITATVPASALTTSSSAVLASPSFTITPPTAYTSTIVLVGQDQTATPTELVSVRSEGDIEQYTYYESGITGSFVDVNDVTYSPDLDRWVAVGEGSDNLIAAYVSDDDGETWSRAALTNLTQSGDIDHVYRSDKFNFWLLTGFGTTGNWTYYSRDGLTWTFFLPLWSALGNTGTSGKVVYGGDYVYMTVDGASYLGKSADLTQYTPVNFQWTAIATASAVNNAIDSGQGIVVFRTSGDAMHYITHGEDTINSIGTLGTTIDVVDIVYGADKWVAFGENFDVYVVPEGDDATVLGNWDYYGPRDTGATGTYTVLDAWYDEGSDGTNGYGFCCLIQGAGATFLREFYTSPDGITWTEREDWVQYEYLRAGGGKYEPTEYDRDA